MRLTTFLLLLLSSFALQASQLDLNSTPQGPIGQYALLLQEQGEHLSLDEARSAFSQGRFSPAADSCLSFGIGAKPVWLRFDLFNDGSQPVQRRLSVETSWLDHLEVYFLSDGQLQQAYRLGDSLPFTQRPLDDRFFTLDHTFAPGDGAIYLRVESTDPLVLPIYLTSAEETHARRELDSYSYGLVYGVLGALLLYNLMLYLGMKSPLHLSYALYLLCFLLMNMAYTGHGYRWLWPQASGWQLWSNPVLMVAYAVSGLYFATRFLDTRQTLPRWHRFTLAVSAAAVAVLTWSLLAGSQLAALLVAFSFVLLYTLLTLLLGAAALRAGVDAARYFLLACVIAAVGAMLTGLTVWGIIPHTDMGYRAVDIGTVIEAILLALALAGQFRRNRDEKVRAEHMARIDPLTGLNNRRSFSELAEPLWQTGLRKQHPMAVIILDLDHFKQINDTFGHTMGDTVLKQTARVLRRFARAGDVLARWGGEEFILLLPETSLEDAQKVAERMRRSIEAIRYGEDDGDLASLSASFGVANASGGADSLEAAILRADRLLYRAKELGRNRVCAPLQGPLTGAKRAGQV
ncbi:MAG TPA: diguanylate cyclase [Gammaproteobacteria bacterium]